MSNNKPRKISSLPYSGVLVDYILCLEAEFAGQQLVMRLQVVVNGEKLTI
jgi:hypothetical protein